MQDVYYDTQFVPQRFFIVMILCLNRWMEHDTEKIISNGRPVLKLS